MVSVVARGRVGSGRSCPNYRANGDVQDDWGLRICLACLMSAQKPRRNINTNTQPTREHEV